MQVMIMGLKIALRNLKRRRFRSLLTGLMFFFGTYLLVFFVGLAEGTYDGMLTLGTRIWSGDFQIMEATYKEKPALYKTLPQRPAASLKDPLIQAAAPRIEAFGLLAYGQKTIGVFLNGIEPAREANVCGFPNTLVEGTWWETNILHSKTNQETDTDETDFDLPSSIPTVVGKNVLKRLGAKLGDELSFISQAADGSLAAELLKVEGVLETGVADLDRSGIFIPLKDAQTMLVLEDQIHKLVGIVHSRDQLPQLKTHLTKTILEWSPNAHFFAWNAIMPELEQTIKADREGLYLFLIIILIVVLLGVANTMMMSVLERQFEIGLLQALGTTPPQIVWIILAEILWLGLFGVGSGILGGMATVWAFSETGFPMGGYSFSYGGVLITEMIPIITFKATVVFPIYILLSGVLSGLIPAYKAARRLPAEALGRTL